MKSPSRLPSSIGGGASEPSDDLHYLIEPPTKSDEDKAAIKYVNDVVLPMAKRRMDTAERSYFNEVGKDRSRRTVVYSHNWSVPVGQEHASEVSADAARLAANCGIPLMRSIREPDQEPLFGPELISFNGQGDACEDFTYPPTGDAYFGNKRGKCRTECRDYDTLVGAVLLAVKHHIGSMGSIRSSATPDSEGWQAAFELYSRTFPEREIPWLNNWPKRSRTAPE